MDTTHLHRWMMTAMENCERTNFAVSRSGGMPIQMAFASPAKSCHFPLTESRRSLAITSAIHGGFSSTPPDANSKTVPHGPPTTGSLLRGLNFYNKQVTY